MVDSSKAEALLVRLTACDERGAGLRAFAMHLLSGLPGYDWVGVYRLDGEELILDEFVGEPTEHSRIAVGKGVCGTAVAEDKNQIVSDVMALSNYLSCSVNTRSEIVVLIRDSSRNVLGQIDVDGHKVGAFDRSDEKLLEEIASLLAARWN